MAIYGIAGKKQHGKNTVAKIWQLLDYYYNIYDRRNINIKNNDVNYVVDRLNNNDYVDLSNWQQKTYADKLKEIACLLLGCTREQLEDNDFKESPLGDQWKVYTGNIPSTTGRYDDRKLFTSVDSLYDYYQGLGYKPETITVNVKTLTPRLLLQLLGTQCGREIIHPEIWINALFADYKVIDGRTFQDPDDSNINYPNWLISDVRFPNEVDAIKQRDGKVIRVNRINHKQYVEYEGKMVEAFDVHPSETSLDNYDGFDYVIEATGTAADLIPKVKTIMIKEGIINGTD